MGMNAVAGSKIYISATSVTYKDTVVAGDFTGVVWTEIGGWTNSGPVGSEQQVIEQNVISSGVTQYRKGTVGFPRMENTFLPDMTDAGQNLFRAAVKACQPYAFKIEWSAGCAATGTVTISQATPGVVTWTAHGLSAGAPVVFTTTGALPAGLTAGTTYYVLSSGLTANSFQVGATAGGAAINTTSAGSGTHTATAQPVGETTLIYGLAVDGTKAGGEANTIRTQTWAIQPIAKPLEV